MSAYVVNMILATNGQWAMSGQPQANRVALSQGSVEAMQRETWWGNRTVAGPICGMQIEVDSDLSDDQCRVWRA